MSAETAPLYTNYSNPEELAKASEGWAKGIKARPTLSRAYGRTSFQGVTPNTSIREGYDRSAYDRVRPSETLPTKPKDIIRECNDTYRRVGLVKNVIDMMADFSVKGIDVAHPNKRIERFYKAWFRRVGGTERSERIANYLLRKGNVVVKRNFNKTSLTKREQEEMERGNAGLLDDGEDITPITPPSKRRIPLKYHLLNIEDVEVENADTSAFIGTNIYTLCLPRHLVSAIKKAKAGDPILKNIDPDVLKQIRSAKGMKPFIRLDPSRISVLHYKKDDEQTWADPLIYSVLADLKTLEKLKLCDLSALDGAVSHIRLWKLGSLADKIMPTNAAMELLSDILLNNVGGGSIDLMWGPDIELQETSTELHKFLGQEKYAPTLNAIYAGLGIPPTMTGSATQSGFTNNFISLQTLTERLNYVRNILIEFWTHEIKLVQKAMGHRFPAELIFDMPVLTDPSAELALIVQLLDRGIISEEAVQERFRFSPTLEQGRIKREERERASGKRPKKASQWHNPQPDHDLRKIALQSGVSTPSEVGLKLDPRKPGEKPALQMKVAKEKKAGKGIPGQGRPKNSKDSQKRKQKRVVPRSKAELFISNMAWARNAQKQIADLVQPLYLKNVGKKNMRQLTEAEGDECEKLKFAMLCKATPHEPINHPLISSLLNSDLSLPSWVWQTYKTTLARFVERYHAEPTIEDVRNIQVGVVSLLHTEAGVVSEEIGDRE